MKIGTISRHEVVTINREATAAQAAERMRHWHVGDLIVVDQRPAGKIPVGIITDRDIVVEVIGQGLNPAQADVNTVMSSKLVTVGIDDEVTDALRAMSAKGVRRAPVVDEQGRLRGIIAMDDLVAMIAAELAQVTRLMRREQEHELRKTEDVFQDEFAT